MSRFFEALQYAEKERLQRDTRTVVIVDPLHCCMEYAVRVRRKGLVDFLFRLVGMYPWQCSLCRRGSHRFRRSILQ